MLPFICGFGTQKLGYVDSERRFADTFISGVLSCEYLSGACGRQEVRHLPPSHSIRSAPICPICVRCLGQLSLVLEFGHESYLRPAGYITANSGHVDTFGLLSLGAVLTGDRGSARSLLKASANCTFPGLLRYCPLSCIVPFFSYFPVWRL